MTPIATATNTPGLPIQVGEGARAIVITPDGKTAYVAALMLLAGLVTAAYATSVVLRLGAEETGDHAEPVLATATGRVRWALSHIAVAVAGAALLLAAAEVATGLATDCAPGPRAPRWRG